MLIIHFTISTQIKRLQHVCKQTVFPIIDHNEKPLLQSKYEQNKASVNMTIYYKLQIIYKLVYGAKIQHNILAEQSAAAS